MKLSAIRTTLLVLPVLAFSSTGFAACPDAPAAKSKSEMMSSHMHKGATKSEQATMHTDCDHSASKMSPDDESLGSRYTLKKWKKIYNEE